MSTLRHLIEAQSWPATDNIESWSDRSVFESSLHREDRQAEARRKALKRTIETQVIPRLLLAHRAPIDARAPCSPISEQCHPEPAEIAELVRLVIHTDTPSAHAHVDIVRAHGVALDAIYIELLSPAAMMLGELWTQDVCSFVDVTIGLSRLQQILRDLSYESRVEKARSAQALLVALPGDQHGFGIFMLQDLFRRAGWQVSGGIPNSIEDLIGLARSTPFSIIGLSVSCDASPNDLHELVATLRRNALNRRCQILVGGRFFIEHPELVDWVGADATATDGRLAVCHLSSFLDT